VPGLVWTSGVGPSSVVVSAAGVGANGSKLSMSSDDGLEDAAAGATVTRPAGAGVICTTAAAPARAVEAVVLSPTNMAAAKIAAVDSNKMTSK